jgi:hypothetical protein
MRLLFILTVVFFTSCKAPIPFYFDKPIGTPCDSFPGHMQGDFFAADNEKVKKALTHSDQYEIRGDGIYRKEDEWKMLDSLMQLMPDSMRTAFQKLQDTVQKTIDRIQDSLPDFSQKIKKENTLLKFDKLYKGFDLDFERPEDNKLVFAFFRFTATAIDMMGIDSLGKQVKRNIFTLGPDLKLTEYKGLYFLNFRTADGWELMMFESWRKKFLCVVPLYITSYPDGEEPTERSFMESAKTIYPGLKPIYGPDKKIRGVKAKMKPDKIPGLFSQSEQEFFFFKPE